MCYSPLVAAERSRNRNALRERTEADAEALGDREVVPAYKSQGRVGRAFRSLKAVRLKVRPTCHWRERRVRAHLFVCLMAYYLEWHLRRRLKPRCCPRSCEPVGSQCDAVIGPCLVTRPAESREDSAERQLNRHAWLCDTLP